MSTCIVQTDTALPVTDREERLKDGGKRGRSHAQVIADMGIEIEITPKKKKIIVLFLFDQLSL